MLVWTIFSLFKVNQERVNSLFMQVQCAKSFALSFMFCLG